MYLILRGNKNHRYLQHSCPISSGEHNLVRGRGSVSAGLSGGDGGIREEMPLTFSLSGTRLL